MKGTICKPYICRLILYCTIKGMQGCISKRQGWSIFDFERTYRGKKKSGYDLCWLAMVSSEVSSEIFLQEDTKEILTLFEERAEDLTCGIAEEATEVLRLFFYTPERGKINKVQK